MCDFMQRFERVSSVYFQFHWWKTRDKYYNKRSTSRENGNVQCHDLEESELNSTIITNKIVYTQIQNNKNYIQ